MQSLNILNDHGISSMDVTKKFFIITILTVLFIYFINGMLGELFEYDNKL